MVLAKETAFIASIALMSPPAEKARPRPQSTAAPIAGSRSIVRSASRSWSSTASLMALSFSGRLSQIQPTGGLRSSSTTSAIERLPAIAPHHASGLLFGGEGAGRNQLDRAGKIQLAL